MGELPVRVQARASWTETAGTRQGALLLRVTEPPVEGRANEAVCRLVAKRLRVAPGSVSVVRGARGRDKLLGVAGIETADLRRRFGLDA